MPNTTVQATAEGMPKSDTRAIMQGAWSIYRRETRMSRPTHAKDRRKLFARCLRTAWAWAKQQIVDALKAMHQRAVERVQELTAELMRIDARPGRCALPVTAKLSLLKSNS